jgi:hypothetical protein
MSVTYHIGCEKCKVHLWIGQGSHIYFGEKETMEALRKFLFEHVGHELSFNPTDFGYYDDDEVWKEIDVCHGDEVKK